MKLDYSQPVFTVDGRQVKIITTEGRSCFGSIPTPIIGYIGDSEDAVMWTKGGRHYPQDSNDLDLTQTNLRFINVYQDGSLGLYSTAAQALLTTKPQLARVKLEFHNGQYDF